MCRVFLGLERDRGGSLGEFCPCRDGLTGQGSANRTTPGRDRGLRAQGVSHPWHLLAFVLRRDVLRTALIDTGRGAGCASQRGIVRRAFRLPSSVFTVRIARGSLVAIAPILFGRLVTRPRKTGTSGIAGRDSLGAIRGVRPKPRMAFALPPSSRTLGDRRDGGRGNWLGPP